MLREKRCRTECRGSVSIFFIIACAPHPWFKRIDLEFTIRGIDICASCLASHIFILAFNIQTDKSLATLQCVEQKHLQQIAFAFTGAAKDQRVGCGFVFGSTVKIDYDGTAIFVIPDIETLAVGFACIGKRKQICDTAYRQHPLEMFSKGIIA